MPRVSNDWLAEYEDAQSQREDERESRWESEANAAIWRAIQEARDEDDYDDWYARAVNDECPCEHCQVWPEPTAEELYDDWEAQDCPDEVWSFLHGYLDPPDPWADYDYSTEDETWRNGVVSAETCSPSATGIAARCIARGARGLTTMSGAGMRNRRSTSANGTNSRRVTATEPCPVCAALVAAGMRGVCGNNREK